MKIIRLFIAASMFILAGACRPPPPDPRWLTQDEVPTTFRATTGCAEYTCEAYRWINTQNGPINLKGSWVTTGVMTDKTLTAEESDMAGLCIGGEAWICTSVVRGTSSIGDDARIYKSQVLGKLHVQGDLDTDSTTYYDAVRACGDVTAKCCCFQACLEAQAEIVCLTATKTGDIHILPSGPYYDYQVVRLSHGSLVQGNIYFHSQRGRVVLDNSSCITGEIYGGHIIPPFECYNQPF